MKLEFKLTLMSNYKRGALVALRAALKNVKEALYDPPSGAACTSLTAQHGILMHSIKKYTYKL
jgi:hypothetical protein